MYMMYMHIIIWEMWAFPFSCCWSLGYSLFERNFESKLQRSIKSTCYEDPFSIESLKESASKTWFEVYFAVSAKTSIKIRRDWENFNMANDQKHYKNYFSLLFLWNEMVLQLFTHTIYRIASALSIAVLLHTKNAVFLENTW